MKEYKRGYPLFSLCGLNCGLCPRFQTEGASKCPGCGGPEFHLKHPTCAVVTCNRKHDNVEFCCQCSSYPCDKYKTVNDSDSFITYRNVIADFDKLRTEGIEEYKKEMEEKLKILEFLLQNFNDGRRKNYYCLAVNLLPLTNLLTIIDNINKTIDPQNVPLKEKIEKIAMLFEEEANNEQIELKLRK